MSAFDAVIFDFGGVITTSPLAGMRNFCRDSNLPWESLRTLFALPNGAWSRYETNALSQADFITAFEAEALAHGLTMDGGAFLEAFFAGLSLRPEMVAVVRALRERMKVGCITNNVRVENRHRLAALDELFDVVVESSQEGIRKPDPRIYQIACERLSVRPERAIFLDDFGVNLKAAQELGMATIKVDETDSAIRELEAKLGFALSRHAEEAAG